MLPQHLSFYAVVLIAHHIISSDPPSAYSIHRPGINGGGNFMTEGTQITLLTKLYFGDDDNIANDNMS